MTRKTVTELYAEFEKARVAFDALPYREIPDARYTALLALCTKLCDRIVATPVNPANPIPEMLIKIATCGWSAGTTEPLHVWTNCGDADDPVKCLVSLRRDLQAMQGAPPRRVVRRTGRSEDAAAAPPR
jgi:hypothetical protein